MQTINRSRPYLVKRPPSPPLAGKPPVDYPPTLPQRSGDDQRRVSQAWLPAKIMAVGFMLTLASMMLVPSLKTNLTAIIVLFTFAGALNLAIVLPLGLMIIKGTFKKTGTLFES